MSGGGGTTTTQSTSNVNMGPWQPQQPYLEGLFSAANTMATQNALQPWKGTTVSPFTPAQTQGYNSIISQGTQGTPFMPASQQNATDTLSGKYLDPSSNPYLTDTFNAAADAVTRQFKTATAPTTDAMFSGNGAYNSSARYNAQNNNGLGLGTTLNNLATSIYGGNYTNERQNQIATQGMVPQLTSAGYIDPTMVANAGTAQQTQNQNELTGQVNQFMNNQMLPWQTMQMYQGLIGGNYGQSGTTQTTQQQPYYSSPFGSALGGGLSLLGTIGSLAVPGASGASALGNIFGPSGLNWSDVRLKEDIHHVGRTNDGQNLYSYRYKGDPTPHVGLMAQEVEKINPDAVTEHPSGFKMVNYDLALLPSVFMPDRAYG